MNQEELLDNEKVERVLSPHPLSFMRLQSLCIFLIVWGVLIGWLVNFSEFKDLFSSNEWLPILVWGSVLIVVGIFASLITIRWRIFLLFLGMFLAGVGVMVWQDWTSEAAIFVPFFSIAMSVIGFLLVELYRRSHKYIISNLRIIFKGGIITKQERTLRYDKIADINAKQGILGQIFSFGTIIPISQSGFGLGSDKSFAGGGVGLGGKKGGGILGFFGGGKDVQTPRARSYYELHGAYPYKEIKKLVEKLVQGGVITQYQQEQVSFQKEQVDIQKQMRDLLKKQRDTKDEGSGEDIEEEEEL
ncbi:MAG: PH domain-containing protein [Candidatus Thermoplasmatota archaeon]|nr:PH domain-containing protein [Candidatus Thermoplasmatota archaeon]